VLVLAVVALEVPLASSVADRIDAEVRLQARNQADVVAASVADLLGSGSARERERVVEAAAASVRGRVIVVGAGGDLLADSEGTPPGRSYSGRPEIAAALNGPGDQLERRSETLGRTLLVTSVPVVGGGRTIGAVRVSQSVEAVDRAVRRAWVGLALIGLLVIGLGLLAGWVVAGQIARPMRRLDRAAHRVAEGDLAARAAVEGSAEQRSLAGTFNDMTARLERLVRSQRDFVADASHAADRAAAADRGRARRQRRSGGRRRARRGARGARPAGADDRRAAPAQPGRRARDGRRAASAARACRARRGALERRRVRARPAAERDRGRRRRRLDEREDADRIFDALVENALTYSPAATAVEVAAVAGGLAVRDRGAGLAPGEEEHVFERFHRGGAGRRGAPGTGLGLPIARELARRWGGDVTLHARHGGGTIAAVTLPPA